MQRPYDEEIALITDDIITDDEETALITDYIKETFLLTGEVDFVQRRSG